MPLGNNLLVFSKPSQHLCQMELDKFCIASRAGWYKNETVVVRTPIVLHLKLMCVPCPILGKTHPYLPTIIFRVAL